MTSLTGMWSVVCAEYFTFSTIPFLLIITSTGTALNAPLKLGAAYPLKTALIILRGEIRIPKLTLAKLLGISYLSKYLRSSSAAIIMLFPCLVAVFFRASTLQLKIATFAKSLPYLSSAFVSSVSYTHLTLPTILRV